jgi:hypothetical protein
MMVHLGLCMRMDYADKDDSVHVEVEGGLDVVDGIAGIAGIAATCTVAPNLEERLVEIAVGWDGHLRVVPWQVVQGHEVSCRH